LVCGNEITPRRVVVGLELSEGIISKTERSKGIGPGGSNPKVEHSRFLVNVADLVYLEMGLSI